MPRQNSVTAHHSLAATPAFQGVIRADAGEILTAAFYPKLDFEAVNDWAANYRTTTPSHTGDMCEEATYEELKAQFNYISDVDIWQRLKSELSFWMGFSPVDQEVINLIKSDMRTLLRAQHN